MIATLIIAALVLLVFYAGVRYARWQERRYWDALEDEAGAGCPLCGG